MNKTNTALLKAFEKGYRVNTEGDIINPKGNKLKKCLLKSVGYYTFGFKNSEKITYKLKIHRLQAYQKFGNKIFEEGLEIRHLDGNCLNNSIGNIGIGNHSENMMDIPKNVRQKKAIYAASFLKKYKNDEVIEFYNNCKSYFKTMEKFNISSKGSLHYILNT